MHVRASAVFDTQWRTGSRGGTPASANKTATLTASCVVHKCHSEAGKNVNLFVAADFSGAQAAIAELFSDISVVEIPGPSIHLNQLSGGVKVCFLLQTGQRA